MGVATIAGRVRPIDAEERRVSDLPTDPAAAGTRGPGEEPSEEEVRQYLAQLRSAPVDQVVAEIASGLLNAAQVKLGRRDGRLLIDLVAVVTDRARGALPDELTSQLDQALTQLRMAQVEAERQVAEGGGEDEANDLSATAAPAPPTEDGQAAAPPPATSRLWVPGS